MDQRSKTESSKPPKLKINTGHEMSELKRELDVLKKVEKDLSEQYAFIPIECTGRNQAQICEKGFQEVSKSTNGAPKNYAVNKLPVDDPGKIFQRSHTWHKRGNPQLQMNAWDQRANTTRGFGDFAPMSPFGFPNYGFPQSAHSWHANRGSQPQPRPDRYVLRPAQQPRRPHTTRNKRFARPEPAKNRRPQTTRANQSRFARPFTPQPRRFQQRPNSARSHHENHGRPGYTIPSSNPARAMSTSTRLSHLAENDRHSFFPSSTRNSYKSMSQTDSSKIRDVFLQICASLESKHGKENLVYPREIIWMIGPPGAGKSTLATFLSDQRAYKSKPIVLREICQSVIAANDGKLKIEQVVEQLMISLFDPQYAQGVVVDGFVSITCARVVPFMFKYFHEIHELSSTSSEKNPTPCVFKFCVLYVNEDNSVRRQLVNHKTVDSGKKFDAEDGRKLYRKFLKRTQQVVELIEMHFSFHLIDANGTLAQVQMIASAEISSDTNGALNHDATLVKALSPAANSKRNRSNRSNSYRNNSFRSNSWRQNSSRRDPRNDDDGMNIRRNTSRGESYRLAPKLSNVAFHSNLSVDISQHVVPTEDRELLTELRASVIELTSNEDAGRSQQNRLPSAKLMPLDTTNVGELTAADEYVVRPNIRGTHCMMYWDAAGTCYLIDRRFNFFTLKSEFYQAAHIGEGLLDGVMVVDTNKHLVFIAHDAATHRSKRLKDCWFSQRSHECKKAVEDLNSSASGEEPIAIVYLDCLPLTHVQEIMANIELREDGEGRLLSLGERQISVHGLTFVPDKPGFHARDGAKIYTWTFREDATRDFKVKAPYDTDQVSLYLQGARNGDNLFQRGNFSEKSNEKHLEIVKKAMDEGRTDWFIMSCEYQKNEKMWVPLSFTKKARASPINAVAENPSSWENRIGFDDLRGALAAQAKKMETGI
jgi:adenylate kinase family enzyme